MKGCRIVSEHGTRVCMVYKGDRIVLKANLKHSSYIWEPISLPPNVLQKNSAKLLGTRRPNQEIALLADVKIAIHENYTDAWHCRLGHLNIQDMQRLKSRAINFDFQQPLTFCEPCVLGKLKASPYSNQGEKADRPRQILCLDVSGPYPKTHKGFQYAINLMCKFSGKNWVYFGKLKSDTEVKVRAHIMGSDTTGEPIGVLETITGDHGGEALSNAFQTWIAERGIFHLTTPRKSPNLNALIERNTQTRKHKAFSMLKAAEKSVRLCHYAFQGACFVIDRSPRRSNINSITPFEAFFGRKPDLSTLRFFGCLCYASINLTDRKSLEPLAIRGTFVGYSERRRGYKVIPDGKFTHIIARTVIFNEQLLLEKLKTKLNSVPTPATIEEVQTFPAHILDATVTAQQKHEHTNDGKLIIMAKKVAFHTLTPQVSYVQDDITIAPQKKSHGKYPNLRRELDLAMSTASVPIELAN